MPIAKFQCHSCGLQFSSRVEKGISEKKCACGVVAPILGGSSISVGFSTPKIEGALMAQSTGMDSLDLSYDRVIGEDARQKWETIYTRRRDKWDIINSQKVQGKDLVRMRDGTYEAKPELGKELRGGRLSAMDNLKNQTTQTEEK
jgi:hypothetical protein